MRQNCCTVLMFPNFLCIIHSNFWLQKAVVATFKGAITHSAICWHTRNQCSCTLKASHSHTSDGRGSLTSRKEALSFSTGRMSTSYCSRELTHAASLDKGTDTATNVASNLINRVGDIWQNVWCQLDVRDRAKTFFKISLYTISEEW